MEYVKKIINYVQPTKEDTCTYNTLWVTKYRDGLSELFIQKNKNKWKPKWEHLGYEITEHIEDFWRDEDTFIKQATFLFDLNEEEIAELKARMPHNH